MVMALGQLVRDVVSSLTWFQYFSVKIVQMLRNTYISSTQFCSQGVFETLDKLLNTTKQKEKPTFNRYKCTVFTFISYFNFT